MVSLFCEEKMLHDYSQMKDYHIFRSPAINLNMTLHGGAHESKNLGGFVSYNDVVQGKGSKLVDLPQYKPRPYIVEQME